jgi:flagella basal body P-ring formation protein FlgA
MLHKTILHLPSCATFLRGSQPGRASGMAPLLLVALAAVAAPAQADRRTPVPLGGNARVVVDQFLASQTSGLSGKVGITVHTPLSGPLPPCEQHEVFLPARARLWGRISVGVRCISGQPWTRYVPAYIAVVGSYHVAARDISPGQALTAADTILREGDLTTLPPSVVVNPVELRGMSASNRIASGAPIRRELLRGVAIVQQGQSIKVVSRGAGFVVSTEGKAMADAALGTVVQVKMQGGRTLNGVVGPDGVVEQVH